MSAQPKGTETLSYLNIMVLVLSIYVLAALLISALVPLPHEVSRVLDMLDTAICVFFLFEFCVRFFGAKDKLYFMRWGWIDLLSSIPTVNILRGGRAARLIRLLRILRAFRSTKNLVNYVFRKKTQGAFTTVSVIAVLMVIFSSIAILEVEVAPDSNIKTAEDAIWWAYVTITTVGYGDKYPVTTEGRIIAAVLMTTGVGLFGTFTGFIASWFVAEKEAEKEVEKEEAV